MNRTSEIQAKYDKEHTKRYGLKLNLKTDSDIIEKLDAVKSGEGVQGYIKGLIREDLKK